MCENGWIFRADVGLAGDLSDRAKWYVAGGFGDNRFTGNGVVVGIRSRW
jgi:hypothetical protein